MKDLELAGDAQRVRVEMDGTCLTSDEAIDCRMWMSLKTRILFFSVTLRICGQREMYPDRDLPVALPNV